MIRYVFLIPYSLVGMLLAQIPLMQQQSLNIRGLLSAGVRPLHSYPITLTPTGQEVHYEDHNVALEPVTQKALSCLTTKIALLQASLLAS